MMAGRSTSGSQSDGGPLAASADFSSAGISTTFH